MVLLGTRAALKDDLGCSTAELVYGATLCLPGEFFSASDDTLPDASNYANQLRTAMQGLQVTPTRTPLARLVCIPRSFVRHDAIWRPLQQPHDGPYKVLQCSEKTFILDINGGRETVSVDRLKPDFLDAAPELTLPPTGGSIPMTTLPLPSYATRLGCHVHVLA